MDDMHEIKELLREIRDLQKAHFERYQEFTQALLDREEVNAEEVERAREEQRRHREEMRRAVRASQASRWVMLAITIALTVLIMGGMMAVVLRMRLP
jgi:t-SNARE complex subunit (syntaxin)